ELGEDLALVRDGGGQHDVVDAHAVGGHQDEVVTVGVDVTHLAGVQQFHVFLPGDLVVVGDPAAGPEDGPAETSARVRRSGPPRTAPCHHRRPPAQPNPA